MTDGIEYTSKPPVPASSKESWTEPHLAELKRAVLAEADNVYLGGTRYHIKYGYRRTFPSSKETVDSVLLTRYDGKFVPMGYVPMSKILAARG